MPYQQNKNSSNKRASRPRRRVSESPIPRSSSSISPERVKFGAERHRSDTSAPPQEIVDSIEYLSDPMSIYSSPAPSKKGNTAFKHDRKPCGHRSVVPSRMSESPVPSGMSSPSMGWSRIATTGHSSNSTLTDARMITVSRRNSMAELAGSEASLSSGFDMDLEIDIDTRTAPSRPHLGFEPRSEVPRRPKRGADEFDSLADMTRGLYVGQKRPRHEAKTDPRYLYAQIEYMDRKARTVKKVELDKMPRRISSGNILAKCTNIPAVVKPVVEKDRSKLRGSRG